MCSVWTSQIPWATHCVTTTYMYMCAWSNLIWVGPRETWEIAELRINAWGLTIENQGYRIEDGGLRISNRGLRTISICSFKGTILFDYWSLKVFRILIWETAHLLLSATVAHFWQPCFQNPIIGSSPIQLYTCINDLHNLHNLLIFTSDIFGGHLLGVKSVGGLAFFDWESTDLVRRIEIQPKNVSCLIFTVQKKRCALQGTLYFLTELKLFF